MSGCNIDRYTIVSHGSTRCLTLDNMPSVPTVVTAQTPTRSFSKRSLSVDAASACLVLRFPTLYHFFSDMSREFSQKIKNCHKFRVALPERLFICQSDVAFFAAFTRKSYRSASSPTEALTFSGSFPDIFPLSSSIRRSTPSSEM